MAKTLKTNIPEVYLMIWVNNEVPLHIKYLQGLTATTGFIWKWKNRPVADKKITAYVKDNFFCRVTDVLQY